MNDTALLDELAQLAARRIGLRVPDDARDRFAGMLREQSAHLGYSSLKDYQTFLIGRQASEEWEELARAFTSGETFFFRDHGQFDLLRLRLLPELIERRRNERTLRLWSAGCASGEEVYSLAMLVDMLLPERDGWDILILGTDIDSGAIAKARCGRYGQWSFRMIPPALQQRYFHLEGNEWLLDERIRRMVTFRVSNLVGEPFQNSASELGFGYELHDMDLILCRNVFIYFDPAAVSAVAAKFAATLREGGYLLTAHTELIGHPVRELESRLFAEGVVYQRRVHAPHLLPSPDGTTSHSTRLPKDSRQACPEPVDRRVAGYPPQSEEGVIGLAREGVMAQAGKGVMAPSLARSAGEGWGGGGLPPAPVPSAIGEEDLLKEARAHADRGEFDLAEHLCHKALAVDPLAAAPYFLLAQLAQIKENFDLAKVCLNKAIYLDSRFVAAYLELAALCERAEDMPRAHTLRRAALGIVRTMPDDEIIKQYETTAEELTKWLAQWAFEPTEEPLKNSKS